MPRQLTRPERLEEILARLKEAGFVGVAELSDALGVSAVTVRSDLDRLQREGRLIRTHGGAIAPPAGETALSFSVRKRLNVEEKERIGAAAAASVADGEAIILDASTTALHVARYLLDRHDLTVLTNGLHVALELLRSPSITVLLPGGPVWYEAASVVGDWEPDALRDGHFQKGFFGGRGLTVEQGLTDAYRPEVDLKRRFVQAVREVNAIVDGSKLGRVAFASCASASEIHRVFTTADAPGVVVEALRAQGIEVMLV